MKQPLLVLTGPTAVGKTKLSIALAKAIGGEIISADSMQVYRHMDIGSAKITPSEMDDVVVRNYPNNAQKVFDKNTGKVIFLRFPDGAEVTYDRETGKLTKAKYQDGATAEFDKETGKLKTMLNPDGTKEFYETKVVKYGIIHVII